ncbi:MAG: cysteine peptidase family C39 domain-containing protein [Candidatus Magasanikbacteria bacterium]
MKLGLKYYPQYKKYSCGPVALKMVFEHLGIEYSRERMIELCEAVPKEGTEHKAIIKEVENEGLEYIQQENAEVNDLIKFLENGYPPIVNYYNPISDCGHYAVVQGYSSKEEVLYLADPRNGEDYTLSFSKFEELWHDGDNTSRGWCLIVGREKIVIN